jgi:hypothetical protein
MHTIEATCAGLLHCSAYDAYADLIERSFSVCLCKLGCSKVQIMCNNVTLSGKG